MIRYALPLLLLVGCSEFEIRGGQEEVEGEGEVTAQSPQLTISPASHDFGEVMIPCDDDVVIELQSTGGKTLEITDISFDSGGLLTLLPLAGNLPAKIKPGESISVTVEVTTNAPELDFGTLTVKSNDPRGPQTAEQAVEAIGNLVTEEFLEPGIPPVDILFLIDQSCSMEALAEQNIQQGLPAFLSELQNVADWQLIQVTKSDGCANGGIMDVNTPNAAQLLSDNAFNVLIDGPYSEQLLKHAEKALSLTDPGECNHGFLRPGASLHVLIASDEAEQSFQSWSHWLNQYYTYVTNPQLVTVSGILNLTSDDVCSDGNGGSPDGYIDAVNATNGTALDICQPGWGSQMTDIATNAVAGIRVYNLAQQAAAGSVSVLVNGSPAIDFEYNAGTNSVTINDPWIDVGDVVSITYGVLAECP